MSVLTEKGFQEKRGTSGIISPSFHDASYPCLPPFPHLIISVLAMVVTHAHSMYCDRQVQQEQEEKLRSEAPYSRHSGFLLMTKQYNGGSNNICHDHIVHGACVFKPFLLSQLSGMQALQGGAMATLYLYST